MIREEHKMGYFTALHLAKKPIHSHANKGMGQHLNDVITEGGLVKTRQSGNVARLV